VPDDKTYEIETLRRLLAAVHEQREEPSRLKKILTWFWGEKVVNSTPKKEDEAA